jgi:raffinose/stachyose/melibiose transport system substrate-binding protein
VTVSLWGIATQPWQVMIDDFQKTYPNLKVKWTKYSTDEMKQAVRVASAAGKMADTWFNWGGSLASPYDAGGHALQLTPELQAQYGVDKNIVPAALDLARYKGNLYGFPIWVRPMTIFYKKSLAGPAMHDKLFSLEASYNSPEVIQAFAKLKEWVTKGYFNDGFISLDPNQALPLLQQDKAAMIFQGPWIEDQNIIASHEDPNNYVPIIAPSDQKPARISGFQEQLQIWAKAKGDEQKAALLFASFITTPEVAKRHVAEFGAPSAVVGVLPPEGHPITTAMAKWLGDGLQLYLPTDQALPQELVNAFFQAQDSVVLGSLTPEAACAQIQKAVDQYKAQQK